ncbi:MAG: cobaltochelatase subunit CobN [Thermoguttaceae bacterium]|nr:cobaltochelatase subunit CobN [Thermoguttaceae bacterium]
MKKRPLAAVITAAAVLLLFAAASVWAVRRPKPFSVAVVGFYDADNLLWSAAAPKAPVRVEVFPRSELAKKDLSSYDAVILRTIGWRPDQAQAAALEQYRRGDPSQPEGTGGTIAAYPLTSDLSKDLAVVPEPVAEKIDSYLQTLTEHNALAFLRLLLREVTGSEVDVPPPEELPESGYFYLGPEISPTLEELFARGDYPAPRSGEACAALIGPFLNPMKTSDFAPVEYLIHRLEEKGFRVVGIYGFKKNPELLRACRPDIVIDFPLGRVLPNDEAPALFSELDVPVLSAISLSVSRRQWEKEPTGMTASYQNLAVALPELDGVTEPTPISTLEPGDDGMAFRQPLTDRIDRLCQRAARWLTLREKPNDQKRLAVFYHRQPGGAITAQSLDAIESLYRTLLFLREQGYNLGDDFPPTLEAFSRRLDTEGKQVGSWAPGVLERFLADGHPERIPAETYRQWLEKDLSDSARKELFSVWGPPPGRYFTGQNEQGAFLIVSRIVFGNIALLPQPTTEIIGDDTQGDDFASVHGTNKAPPHFYLASYLWARERFGADALVHFGTHGSLEFTRGHSLLLSEDDWPDALAGDLPYLYVYSINNIGEALLAKRRTRSVLISHLTAPFHRAGPEARLPALEETEQAEQERLQNTAITDGLHVIGRPWSAEQIASTAEEVGTDDAAEKLSLSFSSELDHLAQALGGGFISPSTGGDPLVNPDSLPTGRNLAGINIDRTPDQATFEEAQRLTDQWLESFRASHEGKWPRRAAITLWGGEYLRTGGLTVAQGLLLLGVRPVFDSKGALRDTEVIPSEQLGRPRIDLLIQTSGQFRDAAPSRIELLDQAVRKVAALEDEAYPNYVADHTKATAEKYRAEGFNEEESAELATARIFGAVGALDYGTGIRRLIERTDRWETKESIADQYLLNMGGVYRGGKVWGVPVEGLLEANLTDTDAILQSRSSNTWGPVKLDHLYEFGTLALVIREKTGIDPDFTLTDARRRGKARNTSLHDAVREELATTLWNRRWLEGIMRGGKSGSAVFPEMAQNLFGWSTVGSDGLIDETIWNETCETLIDDRLGLGTRDYFERTNPGALIDTTAIMLDAVRKGYWSPPQQRRRDLAALHADLVDRFGPNESYVSSANTQLRRFIEGLLPDAAAAAYRAALEAVTKAAADTADVQGVELAPVDPAPEQTQRQADDPNRPAEPPQAPPGRWKERLALLAAALALILIGAVAEPGQKR